MPHPPCLKIKPQSWPCVLTQDWFICYSPIEGTGSFVTHLYIYIYMAATYDVEEAQEAGRAGVPCLALFH